MIELNKCIHFNCGRMIADPWFKGIDESCSAYTHIHLIKSERDGNDLIRCRTYIGRTMIDEQLYLGSWNNGKWPIEGAKSVKRV